jgi:hypothetical protein
MLPALLAPILKPLLANGLNIVANAVVAKGKQKVEEVLGVELKPDMSSEDLARVQIAAMEHEEELLRLRNEESKLVIDELGLYMKDTADARDREVKIATSEHAPYVNKVITSLLALLVLGITFFLFGVMIFDMRPIDASRRDILIYVLGVLSTISTQVCVYYFGSSMGSKNKEALIKEALK